MEKNVLAKIESYKKLDSQWQEREINWFEEHQHLLSRIEDLKHIIETKNDEIRTLELSLVKKQEETITGLEQEISTWKEKYFLLREDLEKYKTLSRSLNRVVEMKQGEDNKNANDKRKLESHLRLSQQALIKLDEEYERVARENELLKGEIDDLKEELKKSNNYAKEFRRINHRMENELYRVNNELERYQSMLN